MLPPPMPPSMQLSPELQKLMDDPEQLAEMMQNPTWEEVEGLLRNNAMLGFRIDIETDSTIAQDEAAEKASRVELVTAVTQFITAASEVQEPAIKVFMAELLGFAVRGFGAGKQIEGAVELLIKGAEDQAKNPSPTPPNPEMLKIQTQQQQNQAEMQFKREQAQADQQNQQQIAAAQAANDQREAQNQAANDQRDAAIQQQQSQLEIERDKAKFQMQLAHDREIEQMRIAAQYQLELMKQSSMLAATNITAKHQQDSEDVKQHDHEQSKAKIMDGIESIKQTLMQPKSFSTKRDAQGNLQGEMMTMGVK